VDDPLQATLADLAAFLGANHTAFALIGGIAVSVRGEPRFTADVDVVVSADVKQGLALLDATRHSAFEPLFAGAAEVLQTAYILPLRHRTTGVKADVAIGLTGFERNVVTRATPVDLGGFTIPVASTEDLLLMKVLAGRPRDIDDARGIVSKQGAALDWRYVMDIGKALGEAIGQDLERQIQDLRATSDG
jgi:predicted nucleotidyltransferase